MADTIQQIVFVVHARGWDYYADDQFHSVWTTRQGALDEMRRLMEERDRVCDCHYTEELLNGPLLRKE